MVTFEITPQMAQATLPYLDRYKRLRAKGFLEDVQRRIGPVLEARADADLDEVLQMVLKIVQQEQQTIAELDTLHTACLAVLDEQKKDG